MASSKGMTQVAADAAPEVPADIYSNDLSAYQRAQLEEIHRRARNSFDALVPNPVGALHLSHSHQFQAVVSPLTGQATVKLPRTTPADMARSFARARRAAARWRRTSLTQRAHALLRLHDVVWDMRDELLDIIQWESGKARYHAYEEVQDVALNCRYYARTLRAGLAPQRRRGAVPLLTSVEVRYQPKGVVGIIAPWNYPLALALSDAVAAIAAGNAVVLKPDSQTPLTALAAAALLRRAGMDPDLLQVVVGPGRELGTPLLDSADYLMFTGSSKTGAYLAGQAGQRLKSVSAELGGKNAMIVLPDANIEAAARCAVRACYASGGQLCVSIERIYVHQAVYEEFKAAFVPLVQQMRIAASLDWEVDMGVMISPEHLAQVDSHVQDALEKGATALAGGRPLPMLGATAYAPTVLEGVRSDMTLYREETFGPVVALYPVGSEEEAIAQANDTEYGLNAAVWSTPAHGREVARRLHAGTVNVNEGYTAAWGSTDAPMGGMGISGLGRRHGVEGLRKYTEEQTIATQSSLFNLGGPKRLSKGQWAIVLTAIMKLMRYLYLR